MRSRRPRIARSSARRPSRPPATTWNRAARPTTGERTSPEEALQQLAGLGVVAGVGHQVVGEARTAEAGLAGNRPALAAEPGGPVAEEQQTPSTAARR